MVTGNKKQINPGDEDSWGPDGEAEVQMSAAEAKRKILEATGADALPPKRRGFGKRPPAVSAPRGKNLLVATLLGIIISVVLAIGAVMYLSPSKAQFTSLVNQVNAVNGSVETQLANKASVGSVSGLSTTVGDANGGLVKSVADLRKDLDLYTAPVQGYTKAEVDALIAGIPAGDQVGLSIITGYCPTVNISGAATDSIAPSSIRFYVVSRNSNITLNATGAYFSGWSVNGNTSAWTNRSVSIPITTNTNIEALCAVPPVTYALTVVAGAGGVASFDGTSPFVNGSLVPIHAVADTGYAFANWSPSAGVVGPSLANTNVSMTAVRSLTANFVSCVAAKPVLTTPAVGNTSVANGSVHFAWSDCGDGVTYNFYFSESSSFSDPILEGLEVPACDWIAPVAGKYYYWKIVAVGACGSKSTVGYFQTAP
jgi:hypothetical protein